MNDFDKRRVRDAIIASLVKVFPEKWAEILAVFDEELARMQKTVHDAGERVGSQSAPTVIRAGLVRAIPDENMPVLHVLEKLLEGWGDESVRGELIFTRGDTGKDQLAKAFDLLEGQGLKVAMVAMNSRNYRDLRESAWDVLELETRASFLRQGIMGIINEALVVTNRAIPDGIAMLVGEVDKVYPEGLDGPVFAPAVAVLRVSPAV